MKTFVLETDKLFTDISDEVQSVIPKGFSGAVMVATSHTTAGLAQLENELLHLLDVRLFLDAVAPRTKPLEGDHRNEKYFHDMISLREGTPPDERVNGHSHVRSLFFPKSLCVPVQRGELQIGDWGRLFFVELDPIRARRYSVTLLAEA